MRILLPWGAPETWGNSHAVVVLAARFPMNLRRERVDVVLLMARSLLEEIRCVTTRLGDGD